MLLHVEVTSWVLILRAPYSAFGNLTWLSSSCLQKVVEEEKQEHVDKVKELLGWALCLKQNVQGRTGAVGSRELGEIEKSISEQQVNQGQPSVCDFCSFPQMN